MARFGEVHCLLSVFQLAQKKLWIWSYDWEKTPPVIVQNWLYRGNLLLWGVLNFSQDGRKDQSDAKLLPLLVIYFVKCLWGMTWRNKQNSIILENWITNESDDVNYELLWLNWRNKHQGICAGRNVPSTEHNRIANYESVLRDKQTGCFCTCAECLSCTKRSLKKDWRLKKVCLEQKGECDLKSASPNQPCVSYEHWNKLRSR